MQSHSACAAASIDAVYEASDTKPYATSFALGNRPGKIDHLLDDANSSISRSGLCKQHGRTCCAFAGRPDVPSAGSPCQSSSRRRRFSGAEGTSIASTIAGHPLYKVTFDSVPQMLEQRRPLGCVFEQVLAFSKTDACAGRSPLFDFVSILSRFYLAVKVVKLNVALWAADCRRQRYFIAASSQEIGGQTAAEAWARRIDLALRFRQSAPTPIFGGALPSLGSVAAQARLTFAQELCLVGQ